APPLIKITSPSMAAKFTSGTSVPITTKVTAGDSGIQRVDFYAMPAFAINAPSLPWSGVEIGQGPGKDFLSSVEKIGSASKVPYSISWQNATDGQFVVFAVAVDEFTVQVASEPVVIIVGAEVQKRDDLGPEMVDVDPKNGGLIQLPKGAGKGETLLPFFPRYRRCPDVSNEIRFVVSLKPNMLAARGILAPDEHGYIVLAPWSNYKVWDPPDPIIEFARYKTGAGIPDSPDQAVNVCPVNPRDPWNTPLRIGLDVGESGIVGNLLRATYFATAGKIFRKGTTSIWDLKGLPAGTYSVAALADDGCGNFSAPSTQVRVLNYCTSECLRFACTKRKTTDTKSSVIFRVNTAEWAIKNKATYEWQVSAGTILSEQGSDSVEVDTTGLTPGSDLIAKVKVGGLYESCENTASLKTRVGSDCYETDESVAEPLAAGAGISRVADRRPISVPSIAVTVAGGAGSGQAEPTPTPTNTNPDVKETEHIQVTWPERMEIEQQERIKLSFNRTTGEVTASSSSGSALEIVNAKGKTLIKDRFGPDYEAFAKAVLGATRFQCDMCGKENYQSLDNETVQWVWSISPTAAGKHTTTVRLDVEWRHRQNQTKKEATIWTKDLPMTITERTFSRKTVFVSTGLFGFVGTGFIGGSLFRRKKGQTIIVAGDLVTGTKGDSYNISGGQIGAVGPNANVHDVKFNDTDKQT